MVARARQFARGLRSASLLSSLSLVSATFTAASKATKSIKSQASAFVKRPRVREERGHAFLRCLLWDVNAIRSLRPSMTRCPAGGSARIAEAHPMQRIHRDEHSSPLGICSCLGTAPYLFCCSSSVRRAAAITSLGVGPVDSTASTFLTSVSKTTIAQRLSLIATKAIG